MAVIETKELTKRYGERVVVDRLEVTVEAGEILGLLGPNGAGKTTTILMLSTLLPPTSGSARVNGFDVRREPDRVRASIGMVFQEQTLDTLLTGRENMDLHGRLYGMPRALRRTRIAELLALVDLAGRADEPVKHYSGGMRRRLEIARGLMHRPAVLFLDEPTLGLDPQTRNRVWEHVRRIVDEERTTVVLTTHYMEEADLVCHRVGIIDRGRIVAMDSPAALKERIGGALVVLRAPGADLDALRAVPGVGQVAARGDVVEATLEDAHHHLPALLAALPRVDSVEVRAPTLNDVFLQCTGRALREEGAGEGWMETMLKASQRPS